MAQTQTLELPSDVYSALIRAASDAGVSPAGWIAMRLTEDELSGWDMDKLLEMIAVSQEQLDRGEYLEFDSGDELLQFVLAKVDACAAKRHAS